MQTQGNNKLRLAQSDKADTAARRTLLREAIQFYSEGLGLHVGYPRLNAILLANRAHVQLLLGANVCSYKMLALARLNMVFHLVIRSPSGRLAVPSCCTQAVEADPINLTL